MSSLLRGGPVRFAVIVAAAFVVSAGCDSGADPANPAPVTQPTPSVEATPTDPPATDEPGQPDPPPANNGSGGQDSGGQNSGASWPTPEDCVSYNPNNLTVQYASGVYSVKDGAKVVMRVSGQPGDTVGDKALALAKRYRKHCTIGRDNGREDENAYVFDYWRDASGMSPQIPDQEEDCSGYDRTNLQVNDMGSGHGWRVKDDDHVLHVFDNETDARNGKLVLAKYHQICSIGGSGDDNEEVVNYMP
jgi:hypothetical protein